MKKILLTSLVMGNIALSGGVQGNEDLYKYDFKDKKKKELPSSILNAVQKVNQEISQKRIIKNKKKLSPSVSVLDLESYIIDKLKTPLRTLVLNDKIDNHSFQTKLYELRKRIRKHYVKKLRKYGQYGRSENSNKKHFAKIWKDAINSIFIEKTEQVIDNSDLGLDLDSDDESDNETDLMEENSEKQCSIRTTLLNIILRRSTKFEVTDFVKKVQTLIDYGADKNLNPEFMLSPKMQNQGEFPLKIAIDEIKDNEVRYLILKVFFNDTITYSENSSLDEYPQEKLRPILTALNLEGNTDYVLNSLIDKGDFPTFEIVLSYLEKSGIFVSRPFEDKTSEIKDQIQFPIIENILKKMRDIRKKCITSDKHGNPVDNIEAFFNSKHIKPMINTTNHDAKFGMVLRRRLKMDRDDFFKNLEEEIELYRTHSEIRGKEFKPLAIEYALWAHFRNRVCLHMNRFALTASNDANKSNVVKLIRYANIHKDSINSNDEEIFKELGSFNGRDGIFKRKNRYHWTPIMYAMAQKQSDGIQLYLRQVDHSITLTDGVDNNVLHLAFPLPERFYKDENEELQSNVLQLVGAEIADQGIMEKTSASIQAVLTERSINKKDKLEALKQLSANNFTPVSLAAAMGFEQIFNELVQFIMSEPGEWNRDDHEHLGKPIEEIVIIGLKNSLKAKKENGSLTAEEEMDILGKIKSREKELEELKKNTINYPYNPEDERCRSLLERIKRPAEVILKNFEDEKGTKRAKDPYPNAIKKAIDQILKAHHKTVTQTIDKSKGSLAKALRWGLAPKKKRYETKTYIKHNPLVKLKKSSAKIKSTYLAPIVKMVVQKYLDHTKVPIEIEFSSAYKTITANGALGFFKDKMNATVEKRMQEVIRKTLKEEKRLKKDDLDDYEDNNRFNQIGQEHSLNDFDQFNEGNGEDDNLEETTDKQKDQDLEF